MEHLCAYHSNGYKFMSKVLKVKNVGDYSSYLGQADRHPLVSVIDYAEVSPIRHSLNNYGVYGMFMHEHLPVELTYGCGKYDYKGGTLICVAPGQIGGKEDNGERIDLDGWALLFHPDLLRGTPLEKTIKECTFFDYHINEALHLTDEERDVFVSLMRQIKNELANHRDDFQDRIIVEYIGLLLNYCMRFYNRQFITRKLENSDVLMKFNTLLCNYFEEKRRPILFIKERATSLIIEIYFFSHWRMVRSSAPFNNLPSCQLMSGYAFFSSFTLLSMVLPPEVAKGITVFPFRSCASMKVLSSVGAMFHQMGKPR